MSNITNLLLPLLATGFQSSQSAAMPSSPTATILAQLLGTNPLVSPSSLSSPFSLGGLSGLNPPQALATNNLLGYPSVGNKSPLLTIIIILLLVQALQSQKTTTPTASDFYQGNTLPKEDITDLINTINKPDPNKPELNTNGINLSQLDTFITKNGVDTRLGKAARVLRSSFNLFAYQSGDLKRISNTDINKFYNLDLQQDDLSSIDQVGDRITNEDEAKILKYINDNQNSLNAFGDSKTTTYADGYTPTFSGTGDNREVRLGTNGDNGIFLSLPSYFIARNRNWQTLIANVDT